MFVKRALIFKRAGLISLPTQLLECLKSSSNSVADRASSKWQLSSAVRALALQDPVRPLAAHVSGLRELGIVLTVTLVVMQAL